MSDRKGVLKMAAAVADDGLTVSIIEIVEGAEGTMGVVLAALNKARCRPACEARLI